MDEGKGEKVIITAAIVGSRPTKELNPAVPYTPEEIAEAALECCGYHKTNMSDHERKLMYSAFLREAKSLADQLASEGLPEEHNLEPELEALKFFSLPEVSMVN